MTIPFLAPYLNKANQKKVDKKKRTSFLSGFGFASPQRDISPVSDRVTAPYTLAFSKKANEPLTQDTKIKILDWVKNNLGEDSFRGAVNTILPGFLPPKGTSLSDWWDMSVRGLKSPQRALEGLQGAVNVATLPLAGAAGATEPALSTVANTLLQSVGRAATTKVLPSLLEANVASGTLKEGLKNWNPSGVKIPGSTNPIVGILSGFVGAEPAEGGGTVLTPKGAITTTPYFISASSLIKAPSLVAKGVSAATSKTFGAALNTGLDKWIATQGRLPAESRSALGNAIVGDKSWLTQKATDNLLKRMGRTPNATPQIIEQAVADTVKDVEAKYLTKFTETNTGVPGEPPAAQVISNLAGEMPVSAEAVQAGRMELKPEEAENVAFKKMRASVGQGGRVQLSPNEVEALRQFIVKNGDLENKNLGIAEKIWTGDTEVIIGVFPKDIENKVGGKYLVFNVKKGTFGTHSTEPSLTKHIQNWLYGKSPLGEQPLSLQPPFAEAAFGEAAKPPQPLPVALQSKSGVPGVESITPEVPKGVTPALQTGEVPPAQPPTPPVIPPATTIPAPKPQPSLNEMNRIITQSQEVVKQDRPGFFKRVLDRIPGIKQILEFERPGLKMTGDKEKILVAHVAESQARSDIMARAAGTRFETSDELAKAFGKDTLKGAKTKIKFVGTPQQAKNPITGTLKDIVENPELYRLTDAQKSTIAMMEKRNNDLLGLVTDGFGAEIGHFPAKPNGAFLPNVDVAKDVTEAIGGEMRAIASGRQKTRFYPTARERMAHDKAFSPELDINKLLYGMDSAKSSAAAGQTFRQVVGGKTRLEVMQETHPELAKKMEALKKRLASLKGSAGRLDEKLDKAISDFMNSPIEGADLNQLQTQLDVKLARGPRTGMNREAIQKEIDGVRAQIKALKPAWEVANLKPYQFVQEGIYRYFPADQAKIVRELLQKGNNPLIKFIENVRGTAFSGDISPIVGVQTPLGIFADPIGAFQQAGGGLAKAIKNGDPLTSFRVTDLAKDIKSDVEGWSQFFSLLGRSPAGTPQEFAGGYLVKIPGFSAFTESTFVLVTRQAKGLYDRTWTSLVKSGMPELQAKVSAITTTSDVFPFINPARLGQSLSRATFLRSMPTSLSFIRKPMEMMNNAARGLAKIATFQRPTPTEGNSLKILLTMAASLMVTSAVSQAINAYRKGEDVEDAIWDSINPDPDNGKFLSVVVGNFRVPIGGPYRALFRAIYPKKLPGIDIPVPFAGLINYIMNRINPFVRTQLDLIQNKDYYGKKIRSGDVPAQILQILEYEIEGALPLTAGAALEAKRIGQGGEETAAQVIGQFAGVNLIENKMSEVNTLRDKYAQAEYGKNYEELNQAERDELTRINNDLKKLEEEAKESFALRGEDLPRVYGILSEQATNLRNTRMSKAAQSLIDGEITKEQYDNERGYIRPYYSGQKNALWQMREQLDPEQAKQIEQYYAESSKPEDKAMSEYWDYYNQIVDTAPLPKDWDSINNQLDIFLNNYSSKIKEYILKNKDDWIKDLPEPSKTVEQQRLEGIEDESWWDDYRGDSGSLLPSLNLPSLKLPSLSERGSRKNPFRQSTPTYTPKSKNPFR